MAKICHAKQICLAHQVHMKTKVIASHEQQENIHGIGSTQSHFALCALTLYVHAFSKAAHCTWLSHHSAARLGYDHIYKEHELHYL
jgi:hypothetical protein